MLAMQNTSFYYLIYFTLSFLWLTKNFLTFPGLSGKMFKFPDFPQGTPCFPWLEELLSFPLFSDARAKPCFYHWMSHLMTCITNCERCSNRVVQKAIASQIGCDIRITTCERRPNRRRESRRAKSNSVEHRTHQRKNLSCKLIVNTIINFNPT